MSDLDVRIDPEARPAPAEPEERAPRAAVVAVVGAVLIMLLVGALVVAGRHDSGTTSSTTAPVPVTLAPLGTNGHHAIELLVDADAIGSTWSPAGSAHGAGVVSARHPSAGPTPFNCLALDPADPAQHIADAAESSSTGPNASTIWSSAVQFAEPADATWWAGTFSSPDVLACIAGQAAATMGGSAGAFAADPPGAALGDDVTELAAPVDGCGTCASAVVVRLISVRRGADVVVVVASTTADRAPTVERNVRAALTHVLATT